MHYRLYPLDRHGRIVGPPIILDRDSDQQALAAAHAEEKLHGVELWQDTKLIYRTEPAARD